MTLSKVVIFGPGWIGQQFAALIPEAMAVAVDIADERAVARILEDTHPMHVINCAGKTGKPNIDSCELDPMGTYRSNVAGAVILAGECRRRSIHFTHMSSGCLYEGENNGKGFAESDPPNFLKSVYARSKANAEAALSDLNALQLRIRLPISGAPNSRNLITKLAQFSQVFRIANSVTILEDFFPAALKLIEKKLTGIFNMVNPGIEYHEELLEKYRKYVDDKISYELISFDTLKSQFKAGRSNCILSTHKLRELGLEMPPFNSSIDRILKAYATRRD